MMAIIFIFFFRFLNSFSSNFPIKNFYKRIFWKMKNRKEIRNDQFFSESKRCLIFSNKEKRKRKIRKKDTLQESSFLRCFYVTASLKPGKKTHTGHLRLAAKVLLTLSFFPPPLVLFSITPPLLFCRWYRLMAVAKFLLDTLIRLHQSREKREDLSSIIFECARTYIV